MMGRMELVEFLRARINEDEAVARSATAGPWEFAEISDGWDGKTQALETVAKLPPYRDGSVSPVGTVLRGWGYDASGIDVSDEDAAHIARWDPARALAECDAKRRIVRDYQHEVRDYRAGYTNVQPGHRTMKHLALPYADHPDYRQEWRP